MTCGQKMPVCKLALMLAVCLYSPWFQGFTWHAMHPVACTAHACLQPLCMHAVELLAQLL